MKAKITRQIKIELDTETSAKLRNIMEEIKYFQDEAYNELSIEDVLSNEYKNFIRLSNNIYFSIAEFLQYYSLEEE